MSNSNNKQLLDITDSLPVATGGLTMDDHVGLINALKVAAVPQNLVQSAEASTTTPTVNKLDYDGISLVERRSRDVKPREKNESLGVPGINQPDVTTGNLSYSDEASTTTPIIDRITVVNHTPYYVDKSDDETIDFLLDCATSGKNRGNQSPSICKVSRILRDLSKSSYKPQLVSIGPLHRENKKLKEFEWLKGCYLDDLLNRFRFRSTPKKTLEACLQKVNTLIHQIRESYAGMKKNYSNSELARMMVMDGCFVLEFCFKHEDENEYLPNKMQNSRIAMDLMLLENQVPFVVLQTLFNCMAPYIGSVTLSQVLDKYLAPYIKLFCLLPEKKSILTNVLDKYLAPYIKLFCSLLPNSCGFEFCCCCSLLPEKIPTTDVEHSDLPEKNSPTDVDLPEKNSTTDVDSDPTHDHVLGYLHRRYQLTAAKSSNREERIENTANHSIVELDRSGMKFKPHQENEWSMTIKFQISFLSCLPWFWVCCCCCGGCCLFPCLSWFWIKPTLRMPTLVIDEFTELILRNFIAYEQSFPHDCYYFTSYVHAMDRLIDTQEDVAILAESKVLFNSLCSNREAADMINKICKNVLVKKFCYTEQFKKMDEYYSGYWPKNISRLRRVYFSNPWSIIALVAAIIVSLATVVATIFAVLDYYR